MNALGKIIFNTAVGVALILIWLRFVNIGEIFQTVSKVNILNLIPVFVFLFLSPFIRAIRLKYFLGEIKKIPLISLLFLNIASMMLNFFIPIRAGEVAKGVYLNTKYDLPLGKSVIWVFLDRFVDFLVVLIMVILMVSFIPTSLPKNFVLIVSYLLAGFLILTYFAIFKVDFVRKKVNFLRPLLIEKHIKIYFDRFSHFILDSFKILKRHPKDLLILILISVLAYGADAGIWYFTFVALGATQDFLKMYLGQLLSALTYLVPAAPGYIGSAEASGLLILSGVFGIDKNLASAMIVLFHIMSALFVLIFGLISIYNLKINVGMIFKKALNKD